MMTIGQMLVHVSLLELQYLLLAITRKSLDILYLFDAVDFELVSFHNFFSMI